MKILVAIDSSGSFTSDELWEPTKKLVNETVIELSKDNEVHIAKVGYLDLRFCTIDEFNNGWCINDGGGLSESLLNGLGYDKVLFITDGYVDVSAFDDKVSVIIPDEAKN